jgi:hypothetical protein
MDIQRFERGIVTFRNLMNEAPTFSRTQAVRRSQLALALPADAVTVSAEQGVHQMREHIDGIRQRCCL